MSAGVAVDVTHIVREAVLQAVAFQYLIMINHNLH